MPGLDPKERRTNREADRAKKRSKVPPLNSPFPFRPTAFDPWYFGVENEPPPVGGEQPRLPEY